MAVKISVAHKNEQKGKQQVEERKRERCEIV